MKEKFYLLGILMVIGVSIESKAQISYNKRALGSIDNAPKTGDFLNSASLDNVDMTTGTLKIGIPLYEIKVNDIVVPITLNYNATGLKVGQEAGMAGMGWELSAGGKIIRNIQGKEDLTPEGIAYNPLPNVSALDPFTVGSDRTLVGDILDGKRDSGWDTYNYSLPNGMSGTFLKNGLTFPYDPLITIVHPGLIKTTDGLEYNFALGEKKKTTRRVDYYRNTVTPTAVPSGQEWLQDSATVSQDWDLATIISKKFNDTVTFSYTTRNYPHATLVPKTRISTSESIPLYREVRARSFTDGGVSAHADDQFYLIQDPIISQSKTETTIHTRMSTIDFPNGSVTFHYQATDIAGQDVIERIDINQKINGVTTLLKRYVFEYDNADQSYGHYLIALHSYDKTNTWQSAYDFTYEGKLPVVPNTGSFAQDSWGFYNGKTTNKTLLDNPDNVLALKTRAHYPITNSQSTPSTKAIIYSRPDALGLYGASGGVLDPISGATIFSIPFADRSYVFAQAIKGTLKSVKTPTGGIYEYEYEPHKFLYVSKPTPVTSFSVVEAGGGIRIKSIIKKLGHDGQYYGLSDDEKIFKKKYAYGIGTYASSGSSNDTIGYGVVTTPGIVLGNRSRYFDAAYPATVMNNMMLMSHPVNNLVQHGGSFGAYQSVTEYLLKGSSSNTYGKTVYYSKILSAGNAPDAKWEPSLSTLANPALPLMDITPGVSRDFGVGVTGVKKYAFRSGSYQTIEETSYTSQSFDAPLNSTNKLVNFYGTITGQMSGPFHGGGAYTEVRDDPFGVSRGGVVINLFNKVNSVGVGRMDYITATNTVFDDKTVNYQGKYETQLLDLNTLSNVYKRVSEQTTVFDDYGYTADITDIKYYYNNQAHLLPSRIVTTNSKGDSLITRMKYPQDFATMLGAIGFMKTDKVGLNEVVHQFSTVKKGGVEYVREGIIKDFSLQFGAILNTKTSKIKLAGDVPYTGTESSTGAFTPEVSYDYYIKGQVHQYKDLNGPSNVVLWGYKNQYPVAKVNNANTMGSYSGYYTSADVAYSSFEYADNNNWTYSGTPIADASSPSGKLVYSLATGAITKSNYTPSTTKYVISYWYKSGASVSVSGGTVGAAVIKKTLGSWTLAEQEISAVSGTVTVSGSGSIDELRFHPVDSQMTTYVYDPLIGITCVMDSKGSAQYYEYDESQRLKHVKDQQGNIVKSHQYIMGLLN